MGVMQRYQGKVAYKDQPLWRSASGLTAHVGGGQTSALQLSGSMASISTVTSAADSVRLPSAVAGRVFYLSNDAASNSMQVFGASTDTINKVVTATGVAQGAGVAAAYFCTINGNWSRVQSS